MRKDFCLCCNNKYVKYAAVTIKSIIDQSSNNDDLKIHILTDYISQRNNRMLMRISNGHAIIHIVEDTSEISDLITNGWSVYTWYRLLLPKILSEDIHRVLYIDCDVIINGNLDSLFTMNMQSKSIAGCIDTQAYDKVAISRLPYDGYLNYICAGVLVVNLDKWREDLIHNKIISYARANSNKLIFPDQDAINVVCCNDKIILPLQFGVLVTYFLDKEFIKKNSSELESLCDNPTIIHYAGYQPWIYEKNKSVHSNLWWRTYFRICAFPSIIFQYWLSCFKYIIKICCSFMKLTDTNGKLSTNKYYNHSKITKAKVLNIVQNLK